MKEMEKSSPCAVHVRSAPSYIFEAVANGSVKQRFKVATERAVKSKQA